MPRTQGGGRVLKGPESHIICLKLIDLCRTNTKRELSPVEVCNYVDVQITKMSSVSMEKPNLNQGLLVPSEMTRRSVSVECVFGVEL